MIIRTTDIQGIQWYKWNGTYEKRDILEIVPKRSAYDVFQNLSLNCWNKTKFACNTNINLIMPGPVSQYTFKYQNKGTQQEDAQRYDKIYSVLERVLASPDESQTECSEAYRQVMAGAFAHENTNVIGPIMALFLIWCKSRFIFSHGTVWRPLKQLISIVNGQEMMAAIKFNGWRLYFDCVALH